MHYLGRAEGILRSWQPVHLRPTQVQTLLKVVINRVAEMRHSNRMNRPESKIGLLYFFAESTNALKSSIH
jgi:hypothetical protein